MSTIILLGAPGSGKGTQAKNIAEHYDFFHLSTGELLRSEIAKKTVIGLQIKTIIDKGNFPEDDIILKLVEKKISELKGKTLGIVFDGFPRTLVQAEALDKMLSEYLLQAPLVLLVDVPQEEIISRLSGRYACSSCGRVYHDQHVKPHMLGICDSCSSTTFTRRTDDKEEIIKQRLDVYDQQTKPLIEFYSSKKMLHNLDGTQTIAEITSHIFKIIECNNQIRIAR